MVKIIYAYKILMNCKLIQIYISENKIDIYTPNEILLNNNIYPRKWKLQAK